MIRGCDFGADAPRRPGVQLDGIVVRGGDLVLARKGKLALLLRGLDGIDSGMSVT